jgi:hypothetical protein
MVNNAWAEMLQYSFGNLYFYLQVFAALRADAPPRIQTFWFLGFGFLAACSSLRLSVYTVKQS